MAKRAYLKVTGPDHSIMSYPAYFEYYWPVLQIRALAGAAIFGLTFYPDTFANVLRLAGWSSLSMERPMPLAFITQALPR